MTVTAIITTFNRASVVARAIESVLAQTRPVEELIVVDDGSTDNTREVVGQYGPSVRYVYQTNQGLAAARNTGAREARSEWVAFLDDDDEWLPRKIDLQLDALRSAPGAVMCYGGPLWMGETGGVFIFGRPVRPEKLWPRIRLHSPICPCTVVVRRDVFARIGGFNEKLRCAEDWEFGVRLLQGNTCVVVDTEPLVKVYETSSSMSKNGEAMLQAELSIVPTMLVGLRGPARWAWKHRVLSCIHYRRAISEIERRQPSLKYLLRSILYWPSPTFMPHRFGTLLLQLYRSLQRPRTPVSSSCPRPEQGQGRQL